jgi:GntR family transcriptional repressor for pyruvate dehydrogenase complex
MICKGFPGKLPLNSSILRYDVIQIELKLGPTTMESRIRNNSSSLTQQVVSSISSLIEAGSLSPGMKLPSESEIVRREGVSRTVVREAISKLQAAGLIETRHGIGSFVRELSDRGDFGLDRGSATTAGDVMALLEIRIGIETEAAALAAIRRNENHLKAMTRAMEAFLTEIHSGHGAITPDFQFHLEIARATGNRYFLDILTTLGSRVIPRSRFQIDERQRQRQEYLERINHEHEDIYNAILRSDPEAARAAVRNHLGNSRERMRRIAEARSTEDGSTESTLISTTTSTGNMRKVRIVNSTQVESADGR